MASLLCLFMSRFAPPANHTQTKHPTLHAPDFQAPSSHTNLRLQEGGDATRKWPVVGQRNAIPPLTSRILPMLLSLKMFGGDARNPNYVDAAVSTVSNGGGGGGAGVSEMSARVETDGAENEDASKEAANTKNEALGKEGHEVAPPTMGNEQTEDKHDNDNAAGIVRGRPPLTIHTLVGSCTRNEDAPKFQSKFMPAGLPDGNKSDVELGDPLRSEYNPEKTNRTTGPVEHTLADAQMQGHTIPSKTPGMETVDNKQGRDNHGELEASEHMSTAGDDSSVYSEPIVEPLTKNMLGIIDFLAPNSPVYIHEEPCPFMKDPNHGALWGADRDRISGEGLDCPDGCVDCEILVTSVMQSKRDVDAWFSKHFTKSDVEDATWHDQEQQEPERFPEVDHSEDEDTIDEKIDLFYGGGDVEEYTWLKELYQNGKWESVHPGDPILSEGSSEFLPALLAYCHGVEYNAIVGEYEPRYLPSYGVSFDGERKAPCQYGVVRDPEQPVWEARGKPLPGICEGARMEYTKKEYDRQWIMYRQQDEARMRYIASVLRDANEERVGS